MTPKGKSKQFNYKQSAFKGGKVIAKLSNHNSRLTRFQSSVSDEQIRRTHIPSTVPICH